MLHSSAHLYEVLKHVLQPKRESHSQQRTCDSFALLGYQWTTETISALALCIIPELLIQVACKYKFKGFDLRGVEELLPLQVPPSFVYIRIRLCTEDTCVAQCVMRVAQARTVQTHFFHSSHPERIHSIRTKRSQLS